VWTGYNPALERIVLKKQQYLAEPHEAAAAEAAPLPTAAELLANAQSARTAAQSSAQSSPASFAQPSPPTSPFAAKLQGALKKES
jgi:hypothetical protein